jgi:hypothetical protein
VADLKRANLRRKWSTILRAASLQHSSSISQLAVTASPCGGFLFHAALRFFEIARVFVRGDHVARFITNPLTAI